MILLSDFENAPGARRYDGYLAILCPFHDDHTPSCLVWADGRFKCLSCGAKGTFEMLFHKLNGRSVSVAKVGNKQGATPYIGGRAEEIALEAHAALALHPELGYYLKRRGVASLIHRCMLGWHEGWYTFPAWNEDGDYAGMSMRASTAIEEHSGLRHFIPPGQPAVLYVPMRWASLHKAERVYVVFGIFDALVMAAAGYPVCTVIGGHRAFNERLVETIRKPIIVVPDRGEEAAASMLSYRLGWRGHMHEVQWPDECKDPADLVAAGYELERYIP